MRKAVKYTNEPLRRVRVIPDFLPPPEELVFRDEAVKVTIAPQHGMNLEQRPPG